MAPSPSSRHRSARTAARFGAADDLSEAGERCLRSPDSDDPRGLGDSRLDTVGRRRILHPGIQPPPGRQLLLVPGGRDPGRRSERPSRHRPRDEQRRGCGRRLAGAAPRTKPGLSRQRSAWARTASLIRRKSPPPAPTSSTRMPPSTARATRPWSGTDPTAPTQIAQAAGYDAEPTRRCAAYRSRPRGRSACRSRSRRRRSTSGRSRRTPSTSATDQAPAGPRSRHTYSAPGTYQVTATAVDAAGTPASGERDDRDLALLRVPDRQAEAEPQEGDGRR